MKIANLFKSIVAAVAVTAATAATAFTPSSPVQVIIGWPPGSGNEIAFRAVAATVQKQTGINFVVVNRPGADELIATNAINKMSRDGSQLAVPSITMPLTVNTWYKDKLEHPVEDIILLMTIGKSPLAVIAPANSPINTPAELVKLIRETKKPITFGLGAGPHDLVFEYIMDKTNGDRELIKSVMYKGPAAAVTDVAGSQVDFAIVPSPTAWQFYKSGKIKYIGLAGDRGFKQLPGVQLMKDTIPGLSLSGQWFLAFPAGTKKEVLDYYQKVFKTALESKETIRYFEDNLMQIIPQEHNPEGVRLGLANTLKTWKPVAEKLTPKYSFK